MRVYGRLECLGSAAAGEGAEDGGRGGEGGVFHCCVGEVPLPTINLMCSVKS